MVGVIGGRVADHCARQIGILQLDHAQAFAARQKVPGGQAAIGSRYQYCRRVQRHRHVRLEERRRRKVWPTFVRERRDRRRKEKKKELENASQLTRGCLRMRRGLPVCRDQMRIVLSSALVTI